MLFSESLVYLIWDRDLPASRSSGMAIRHCSGNSQWAAKQFLTVKEPPQLSAQTQAESDEFYLTIIDGKGLPYKLENSTDLTHWTHLTTLTNAIWTNRYSQPGKVSFIRASEQ